MREIAVILCMLFMDGCATWRSDTEAAADKSFRASVILRDNSLPAVEAMCNSIVDKCLAEKRAENCPEMGRCKSALDYLQQSVTSIQLGARYAKSAVGIIDTLGIGGPDGR